MGSPLLPELYGTASAGATIALTYMTWRYNPWRLARIRAEEQVAAKLRAAAERSEEENRRLTTENHAALWGAPELRDDSGAVIRSAQPGLLAEVRALRQDFPGSGWPGRTVVDELRAHRDACELTHAAMWRVLMNEPLARAKPI